MLDLHLYDILYSETDILQQKCFNLNSFKHSALSTLQDSVYIYVKIKVLIV